MLAPMKRSTFRRLGRGALVLALLLALGACSTTRLAYNRAERLLAWWIDDYVELDAHQKARLHERFVEVHAWHRRHELPRYALWLDGLAGRVERGAIEPAQFEAWTEDVAAFAETIEPHSTAVFQEIARSLSEAQVDAIEAALGEKLEDAVEEAREQDDPVASRRKALEKQFRKWTGSINRAQQALLDEWAQAAPVVPVTLWHDWRLRWNAEFVALLRTRREPGFALRSDRFNERHDPEQDSRLGPAIAANQTAFIELLSRLSATLEPRQRAHLAQRLRGYAEDCRLLAARQ